MLYSIIPPILIVLSLIGIILLLMKKSKEVAQMPSEEFPEDVFEVTEKKGLLGKVSGQIKKVNGNNTKQFLLAVSEKITRKFRVLFLKLESKSANLSNTIREKRNKRSKKMAGEVSIQRENDIIRKVEEYGGDNEKITVVTESEIVTETEKPEISRKEKLHQALFKNEAPKEDIKKQQEAEEREIKPIISDRVVVPRVKTEIRDRLEELLIERIAVNPKDIEAYERLGEYYLEIKSYTDSKECFKQVLKLDPKNKNAKYRMRRLENLLTRA